MSEQYDRAGDSSLAGMIALLGFVLVATAQVTNMILARGLACGGLPPHREVVAAQEGDSWRPTGFRTIQVCPKDLPAGLKQAHLQ